MKTPLISYFGEPSISSKLKSYLLKEKIKIWLRGLSGSSFSIASSATIQDSIKPHLFIFAEKEEADKQGEDTEMHEKGFRGRGRHMMQD